MNLILIHIGASEPPSYLYDNLEILSRLCKKSKKYFITNISHIKNSNNYFDFEVIPSENIERSIESTNLENKISIDKEYRNGFWQNTTTRFAILHDFIKSNHLIDNIHIENDVVLYKDPANYVNYFNSFGGISFPTVVDWGIGSVVWIKNGFFSEQLIIKFSENCNVHDMENLGLFSKTVNGFKALPTIPISYQSNKLYDENFCELHDTNIIFDAAALGQYLGGVDPANSISETFFFINERTTLEFDKFQIQWEITNGIKFPIIISNNLRFEIFNLHIHSKKIFNFSPYNFYSAIDFKNINSYHNIYLNSDICILKNSINNFNLVNIYTNTNFHFPLVLSNTEYYVPTIDDLSLIDKSYCIFIDEDSILYFIKLVLHRLKNPHKLIFSNNSDIIHNFAFELNSYINLQQIFLINCQFSGVKFKSWLPVLNSLSINLVDNHNNLLISLQEIKKTSTIYCNTDHNNFKTFNKHYNLVSFIYNEDDSNDFIKHLELLKSSKFYLFLDADINYTLLHQCFMLNSIPIMLKSNWEQSFFEYPIITLNNWEEFSNLDFDKLYLLYNSNFIINKINYLF